LKAASPTTSRIKQLNRAAETRHESILRSELWRRGYRFRKNVRSLPGNPDIVFQRERVAVFCDGDFWHGRDWSRRATRLRAGTNATYWLEKIRSNIRRDRRIDRELERDGWTVIRLWETDILKNARTCAARIASRLRRARSKL
jgi:DNA mismatch endonuclease (patch repair protein)